MRKIFFKSSCNFHFVFVPYMRAKNSLKWFGNIPKIKSNFTSVATLAVLAITLKQQAEQSCFFASGYSLAVLATTLKQRKLS